MAIMKVNPTRMELTRLKNRLKVAARGHKLLKDKRDEMVRRFMQLIRENKSLREQVEKELGVALTSFTMASLSMSEEEMNAALLAPARKGEIEVSLENIMSVNVPVYSFRTKNNDPSEIYPYGFAQTSGELDDALEKLARVFEDMLELAQVEKTMQLLAQEEEFPSQRMFLSELFQTQQYVDMVMSYQRMASMTKDLYAQKGDVDAAADGADGPGGVHIRHGHPDDLAPGLLQTEDLGHGALHVLGGGIAHGLDADRRAAAHGHGAHMDLFAHGVVLL